MPRQTRKRGGDFSNNENNGSNAANSNESNSNSNASNYNNASNANSIEDPTKITNTTNTTNIPNIPNTSSDFSIQFEFADEDEDDANMIKIQINQSTAYMNEWTGTTKIEVTSMSNGSKLYSISGNDLYHKDLSFMLSFYSDEMDLGVSLGDSQFVTELPESIKEQLMAYIELGQPRTLTIRDTQDPQMGGKRRTKHKNKRKTRRVKGTKRR